MILTPASDEVMLCGVPSALSMRSVTGLPTLTTNSVCVHASCFLPSGPGFHDPMILTGSTCAVDVAAAGEVESSARDCDGAVPLLLTRAIADMASAARIPAAARASAAAMPWLSPRPSSECPLALGPIGNLPFSTPPHRLQFGWDTRRIDAPQRSSTPH